MTYSYRGTMEVPVETQLVVRRVAGAKRVEAAPAIDGVLDDACWTDEVKIFRNISAEPISLILRAI
mgnify:CR=1 FL=1